MGTNPKYFKHPAEVLEGINLSERNVAGHRPLGVRRGSRDAGPDKAGDWDAGDRRFLRAARACPKGHSMHNHNLLPTFQVRIRDLDQWVTIDRARRADRAGGRLCACARVPLRQSERQILRRDYISALPGINAPGSYDEYARNPGAYWAKWAQSIEAGTYEYFKP